MPKWPNDQFKLVQQSRKQALRAYCPNICTVPEGMSDSNNSLYAWNCSTNVGGPLGPTCDIGK